MGTSHGYAEKEQFTSATLIENSDFYYLLDAGAPVEWIMVNTEKPYDKIRGIFITHMHNDHVGSLSTVVEENTELTMLFMDSLSLVSLTWD